MNAKGFTIIELLVAIAISSIAVLLVSQVFISTNKMNTIQENVASVQQDTRSAMDIMSRDIMMAGLNPQRISPNPGGFFDNGYNSGDDYYDNTDADSIALKYDYNGDGVIDNNLVNGSYDVDRCYYYDSTNECLMMRDGANAPEPLTDDTKKIGTVTVSFSYTLADGSIDPDPSTNLNLDKIRIVNVQICGKIAGTYATDHPNNYCFSRTIKPRNL